MTVATANMEISAYSNTSIICQEESCEGNKCQARHSKKCKVGQKCTFFKRNVCAYVHEQVVIAEEENKHKISELERELVNLKIFNESLKKENDVIKNDIKDNIIDEDLETVKIKTML